MIKTRKRRTLASKTMSGVLAATMVVGMALVSELFCLLIVFTAALLAGTMALLVSWTSEQKALKSKQAAETKNYTLVILIQRHSPTFRSAAQIS